LLRDENTMVYVSDINEERTGQVAKKVWSPGSIKQYHI